MPDGSVFATCHTVGGHKLYPTGLLQQLGGLQQGGDNPLFKNLIIQNLIGEALRPVPLTCKGKQLGAYICITEEHEKTIGRILRKSLPEGPRSVQNDSGKPAGALSARFHQQRAVL